MDLKHLNSFYVKKYVNPGFTINEPGKRIELWNNDKCNSITDKKSIIRCFLAYNGTADDFTGYFEAGDHPSGSYVFSNILSKDLGIEFRKTNVDNFYIPESKEQTRDNSSNSHEHDIGDGLCVGNKTSIVSKKQIPVMAPGKKSGPKRSDKNHKFSSLTTPNMNMMMIAKRSISLEKQICSS